MASNTAGQEIAGQSKAKVFISYSRKDMAFADRLEAVLKARGFEPLIDRSDIFAFEKWWERIEALISGADTVVFVLSPDSVASEVALKEVTFAASLNKRFAPIVCRHVEDKQVPEALARLNFIFFDDPAQFEASATRLAEALATDIGWIRQHTEFGEAARRWALAKTPNGLLLRSPVLEEAERWIAARPRGAPAPTEETQTFIRSSRQAATRRRNVLTGSLAAGLVVALSLASLAYWQRGIAVEQRDKATRNFKLAQQTAEGLVFDIAQGLRNVQGMSVETVRKILETSRATFEQLAKSAPDDLSLQRSRAVMLGNFGDTYLTLGDLEQALEAYRDGLAISERLAAADRSNTEWQRDVAVTYQKIADVLASRGELEEALKAYRDGLGIFERLAAADRSNTRLQRDLSISYEHIGDVLMAQGKLDEALALYRDSLAIVERLSAADPGNTDWQRDVSVEYNRLGHVLEAQGKLEEALAAYRNGLAIVEQLAASDRSNTEWQIDVSLSYITVGDVLMAQRKLNEALAAYRNSLAIVGRLAAADLSNTDWQRNLSIPYDRIGNVLVAQGELDEALAAYRNGLAIRERLAAADRSNTDWQRDLAVSHSKLAAVYEKQGRITDALLEWMAGRDILAALVAAAPGNAQWTKELAGFEGEVVRLQGLLAKAQ